MKRTSRAVLALAVGFVGATAAVHALDRSTTSGAEYVGSPDLFDYCRAVYGSRSAALRSDSGAAGWRCAARVNGLFGLMDIDVDRACEQQFGDGATARTSDSDDAESWECWRS